MLFHVERCLGLSQTAKLSSVAIKIHWFSHVVVLIHLLTKTKTTGSWSLSFSTMCQREVGYLTSAVSGNVTSTHFSHSTWRTEGLSGCRPRERDVHLFPANENGSPPFLLESCHIDSTDRQRRWLDWQTCVFYDFFILTEQTELDILLFLTQIYTLVFVFSAIFYSCCVIVSQEGNEKAFMHNEAEIKQKWQSGLSL